MRTPKPIKTIFLFLVIFLPVSFSPYAYGLTAETDVHTQYTIEETGAINMDIDITNTGTAKIYDVVATITIAGWAEPYDEIKDIPPGGTIHIKSRYVNPMMRPGKYIATVLVNFEERGGALYRKYHFFEIAYRLDKANSDPRRVRFSLESPVINKKILWGQKRNIMFSMKNLYQEPIDVRAHFCLPRGLASTEPSGFYTLAPGEEKWGEIPLILSNDTRHKNTYHAVIWYEQDGIHYSELLKDKIVVISKPVYFRWYIVLGMAVLLILSGITYYRGKRR